MATQTFKNFKAYAGLLEKELGIKYDAKPYKETIRIMLDGFCEAMDAGDERLKNMYIAGLILRFWDKVGKLEAACPNIGMSGDDFVDWIYEAIMLACDYRKWQKDPSVNAQQCINQCIETIRVRHYYDINLDKRKASYMTVSVETPLGDEGDDGKSLGDTLADDESEREAKLADGASVARDVVQAFLDKGRIVEAIVMDVIAFGDSHKETKRVRRGVDEDGNQYKYTSYGHEFWRFKAVRLLAELPQDYGEYFRSNYAVKAEPLEAAIGMLRSANNGKLYRELDASLKTAKALMRGVLA